MGKAWFAIFIVWVTGGVIHWATAQESCPGAAKVEGVVTDTTGALLPRATVQIGANQTIQTDLSGNYSISCVSNGNITLTVTAAGFAPKKFNLVVHSGKPVRQNIQLAIAQVEAEVQVNGSTTDVDTGAGLGMITLNSTQIQRLADDPDDFLRELQMLGSSVTGGAGSALIMVDGFMNASALPPKSSIASIRINPDIFAPEFQSPPWVGATIQLFTKPGADTFHGALFLTNSNGIFNATDPFSTTTTPAGKQRYGFELTGPLVRQKSDFSVALERRAIDEFNVVNAVTLDAIGNQTPTQQTVAAPQRLWIGSGRADWQISTRDLATLSFSSNVNSLGNQGIGGLILPEAGYNSEVSENDLRFTNTQPLNANLLHETRIGYTWKRTDQTPLSTAPSLQVAGYFTEGGATAQHLNDRERDLEVDDDLMFTRGKHEFKAGVQSFGIFMHDDTPTIFNGAYVFGGGSGPVLDASNQPTGQTTGLTPLQQYERALHNLPGGRPTTYQITTGTPLVAFTQWLLGFYAQDTIELAPRLTLATGLRYQLQTSPASFGSVAPRLGLSWAPDKRKTWVFHARAGIFADPVDPAYAEEAYRLNGTRQQSITVYSPNFNSPLTPVSGFIQVRSLNHFAPTVHQVPSVSVSASIEHDFPHHWHVQTWFLDADVWGQLRIRNINAPMVADSVGTAPDPTTALLAPRPFTPNENIFQYENSGHQSGILSGASLSQQSYKRFGFSLSYKYENVWADGNDLITSPQSSYSNRGESSHIDWNKYNNVTFSGFAVLPLKINLATQFDAHDGSRYNITTGTDANGDGDFNDRPSYATVPGPGVYSTRYGLLTTNTVNGDVQRNLGIMPGLIHLDMNASRYFVLTDAGATHTRTLTFNVRSSNLLNHTNVTAVGTILSSSTFAEPLTAEAARRIELGVRFAF